MRFEVYSAMTMFKEHPSLNTDIPFLINRKNIVKRTSGFTVTYF